MSLAPLYVLLGEVSVQVLCPFFNWFFCLPRVGHVSSLYILEIKPLSELSLANMFSHIVGSLLILLMFSLAIQKLLILLKSSLFILSFISLALGDMSVRMLLGGMCQIFLPMFSSRTFIHLEFIFVYGVSWWSIFIFLHVDVQISQHHLLKRLFLLHFVLLPPLPNINWP